MLGTELGPRYSIRGLKEAPKCHRPKSQAGERKMGKREDNPRTRRKAPACQRDRGCCADSVGFVTKTGF